jgi:hypothetical protein
LRISADTRDPHCIEVLPARPQQRDLAVELRVTHRFGLDVERRERDAPEICGARAHLVLDDLEASRGVELLGQLRRERDRTVALPVRLE